MGSGVSRIFPGMKTGTGSVITVREVGFRPKMVKLFNITGNARAAWIKNMADASMQKEVDGGTGVYDISFVTSGGITPLASGFTIGTDTDLNVSDEVIRYIAYE
jgi:hypothetical protein